MRAKIAGLVADYFAQWRKGYEAGQAINQSGPHWDVTITGPGGLADIVLVKRIRAVEIEEVDDD
jgi:hypothetical protein